MNRFGPAAALLAAMLVSGCEPGDPLQEAASRMSATEFLQPYDMPVATLVDQNGENFDLRLGTRDQLTLVFFGYTSCPDICPLTMASIARAVGLLEPEVREHVGVLFISLDANRDDPERIEEWLESFDPTFVGVTGTQDQLDEVLGGLGYVMPPYEIPAEGFYEVPHPAAVFVFTPERLGRFGYGHDPDAEQMAADLSLLAEVWWPEG